MVYRTGSCRILVSTVVVDVFWGAPCLQGDDLQVGISASILFVGALLEYSPLKYVPKAIFYLLKGAINPKP